MSRPRTSKPRGICSYYNTPRGCRAEDSCKFLHGPDELFTPYDKSKACRFYTAGYCKHGDKCWFRHVKPNTDSSPQGLQCLPPPLPPDDNVCGICLEEPVTFGLLSGCSHVFCIECIRNWRDPKGKSEDVVCSRVNKKCPYCRAPSSLVLPSSHFYPEGHLGKSLVFHRYKTSLSKVPCKYFQASSPKDRYCPFGRDCLYQHRNPDGTPYVFFKGVNHYMPQMQRRLGRGRRSEDSDTYIHFGEMRDVSSFIFDLFRHLPANQPNEGRASIPSRPAVLVTPTALTSAIDVGHSEAETPTIGPSFQAPLNDDHIHIHIRAFDLNYTPDVFPFDTAPDSGSMPSLESTSDSSGAEDEDGEYDGNAGGSDDDDADDDLEIVTMASGITSTISRFLNQTHVQPSNVHAIYDTMPDAGQEHSSTRGSPPPQLVRLSVVSHTDNPSEIVTGEGADGIELDTVCSTRIPSDSPESTPHDAQSTLTVEGGSSQQRNIESNPFEAPDEPAREPPFTTDGRGRVVWSRDGSKSNGSSRIG